MTQIPRQQRRRRWMMRGFVLLFSFVVALISALLFMSTGVITLPFGIVLVCCAVIALESTAFFDSIKVLASTHRLKQAPVAMLGLTATGSGLTLLILNFLVTKNLAEAVAWMVTITMVIGVGMLFGVSLRPHSL